MIKIGVIGGTGLENISGMTYEGAVMLDTVYGAPSSHFRIYKLKDCLFYFLNRHGDNHEFPPHSVNYRANISGFKQLGVTRIVSFSTVGGINPSYKVGSILLLDNALDFTGGSRVSSFYEGTECVHIDLTYPFCSELKEAVKRACSLKGVKIISGGVYVCTNGPRFETSAEIKMYSLLGGDVVGMTMFPEVSLAREAEICYSSVAIVTNPAAGIINERILTMEEVTDEGRKAVENVCKIIEGLSESLTEERVCKCKYALKSAGLNK